MKLVLIEWVDSGRADGWDSPESVLREAAADPMVCQSIGWLLDSNDRYVVIVGSQKPPHKPGAPGEVLSPLQIPREAVREMKTVTVGRRLTP